MDDAAIEDVGDLFRLKEKQIKAYFKSIDSEDNYRKRKQLVECDFKWTDLVDLKLFGACDALHSSFVSKMSTCCSNIAHSCQNCSPEIYELQNHPGLFIIVNALCLNQQIHWAKVALEVYSNAEHNNLSNLAKQSAISQPAMIEKDIWYNSCKDGNNFLDFKRLRWSCLGYHYNWTKRAYVKDEFSDFPNDFAKLCQKLAGSCNHDFVPEAAIVNYYPINSCMGGHLDDAEHNLAKPIVSMSFGRSAVFLIGGKTKHEDPTPILLRSGDAIIMTGESRLCYHGVPAIIPYDTESRLCAHVDPLQALPSQSAEESYIIEYLRANRINMNVRQVKLDTDVWIDKTGTGYVKY